MQVRAALVGAAVAALAACACPAASAQPDFGCTNQPSVDPGVAVPSEVPSQDQETMNCFAWQEFIALNWPADTSSCTVQAGLTEHDFGEPNDTDPVVWETFKEPGEIFLPDAAEPDPWCSSGSQVKSLHLTNKFEGNDSLDLTEIHEAAPEDAWLTTQGGNLTYYEIRVNEDEFEYILEKDLYNAVAQRSLAESDRIELPDGGPDSITYGKTGSMELKAAWIELPDSTTWPDFKTSRAWITDPATGQRRQVTVGLVGLHIIHKTQNNQQFTWATFEHVDNAPSRRDIQQKKATGPYTYYDPSCQQTQCPWNIPPATDGQPDYTKPQQVVRMNPLDTIPPSTFDVVALNEAVHQLLDSDSVFQNYQLVNVLWPNQSQKVPAKSRTPLPCGDPQPEPPEHVANTTLETYVQGMSCLDCHMSAPVSSAGETAPPSVGPQTCASQPSSQSNPYAADYSFLLSRAQVPPADDGGLPVALLAGVAAAAAAGAGALALRRRRAGRP